MPERSLDLASRFPPTLLREALRSEPARTPLPPREGLPLPSFLAFDDDDPAWDACADLRSGPLRLIPRLRIEVWCDRLLGEGNRLLHEVEMKPAPSHARLCARLARRAQLAIEARVADAALAAAVGERP